MSTPGPVIVLMDAAPPGAWPGLSSAQVGAAKAGDTVAVVAQAPGGMYVQRNRQLQQLLTGFEQKNTLYCFNWTPSEKAGVSPDHPEATADFSDTVLRMREESDCCTRFCIGSLRPFRMSVYPYSKATNFPPKGMDTFSLPNAVTIERPCRLPILCAWRPLLRLRHNSMGYFANIRNPFTFLHCEPRRAPPPKLFLLPPSQA